jgi:hypothetical protein
MNGHGTGLYTSKEELAKQFPLEPGDVVLTSGNTLLGRLIRWGERKKGEPVTRVNHALLCTEGPDTIVEADKVVRKCSIWDYHHDDGIIVWRPRNLTDLDKVVIKATAEFQVGQKYPIRQLFAYLIDNKILGGRNVFRRLISNEAAGVCSRLVARVFKAIGRDFGVPEYAASPDEIDDFCTANPDKYVLAWRR